MAIYNQIPQQLLHQDTKGLESLRGNPTAAGQRISQLLEQHRLTVSSSVIARELQRSSSDDTSEMSDKGGDSVTIDFNWWGYQVYIPQSVLDKIKASGDVASAIAGFVGTVIAASGGTAAVLAPIVVAYMTAEWLIIIAIDNGSGILLSATWFAPMGLVPTRA